MFPKTWSIRMESSSSCMFHTGGSGRSALAPKSSNHWGDTGHWQLGAFLHQMDHRLCKRTTWNPMFDAVFVSFGFMKDRCCKHHSTANPGTLHATSVNWLSWPVMYTGAWSAGFLSAYGWSMLEALWILVVPCGITSRSKMPYHLQLRAARKRQRLLETHRLAQGLQLVLPPEPLPHCLWSAAVPALAMTKR